MDELDINKLNSGISKNIKIGELSLEVINLLNLDLKPQNINIWGPRLQEYCEKHKNEYSSATAYMNAIKSIPKIIQEPDYIGIHKENGNIQYIKKLDDISLIGIKILKGKGGLLFRTIFPITQDKLEHYIRTNRVIQYKKEK